MTGSVANDVLIINGQGNHLLGRDGNDRIVGGANYVSGFGGGDVLDGGDGDDQLSGGFSRAGKLDTLLGGNGDDRLDGGNGQDLLTGGAGADIFLFTRAGDSRSGVARADTISDFASGLDRISLSGIDADIGVAGDQAFAFIGAAAFGLGTGQVRYGAGMLEADVDGDGLADFQVLIAGAVPVLAGDISL